MDKQQAYYFDFYGSMKVLLQNEREEKFAASAPLRDAFEAYWIKCREDGDSNVAEWQKFRMQFQTKGLALPIYPSKLPEAGAFISILYSAKHGRSIGWDYSTLVKLAHWVVAKYPQYLQLFRKALFVYERGQQLVTEDTTGNWREKAAKYKKAINAGDSRYSPDTSQFDLVAFLFPELVNEVGRLL
jgi:hypothetical protein